jgi:transcriptional regulator with XRE-family HTH domain
MEAVGERIKMFREVYELTQQGLAHKLNVTQPAVSQWEKGKRVPPKPLQFALADAFRTERSSLFAEVIGRTEAPAA